MTLRLKIQVSAKWKYFVKLSEANIFIETTILGDVCYYNKVTHAGFPVQMDAVSDDSYSGCSLLIIIESL